MNNNMQILILGKGGNGVILLGRILSELLCLKYKFVSMMTSYGPESRGSSNSAQIISSDMEIDYPAIISADYLLSFNPGIENENQIYITNNTEVINVNETANFNTLAYNITGEHSGVNLILLGYFAKKINLLTKNKLISVLNKKWGNIPYCKELALAGWSLYN